MCGIVGLWSLAGCSADPRRLMERASLALGHRGPDADGLWWDESAQICLAHRRLSVVDLSDSGSQPMCSPSGRFVIVFNGEIYGYRKMRQDFIRRGVRFTGTSDTEVLLAAIDQWGVQGAVRRVDGMFAFAVWDRSARALHLVRDRVGEKPLYWFHTARQVGFASELKGLIEGFDFEVDVDQSALAAFLRLGYVPAPYSILSGVEKLPPGHGVSITNGSVDRWRYWTPSEPSGGEEEPLLDLLRRSVEDRMIADVPIGAFLSGGIDSSTIVALMAERSSNVKTFTVAFEDPSLDESAAAAAVALHLGTDHTQVTATEREALAIVPELATLYDEPFADQSAIPTVLVSRLARPSVSVVLSGDGGDELFGGYERYVRAHRLRAVTELPVSLRRPLGAAALRLGGQMELWPHESLAGIGRRLRKIAPVLTAQTEQDLYLGLVSNWVDPSVVLVSGAVEAPSALTEPWASSAGPGLRRAMTTADFVTYLPDDILVKIDRATMSVGLEARVPLLSRELISWARNNPHGALGRKAPLREVLYGFVPAALVDRPKQGFAAPVGAWLRGPLREWAEDLLSSHALRHGLLRSEVVGRMWREHLAGHDFAYPLWTVLTFQAWYSMWATE